MKTLTIALWISLFSLMSFGVAKTWNVDSVQFNTGTDDNAGTLSP